VSTPPPDNGSSRSAAEAIAIADLAAHTGVEAGDIAVVTHERVTWRNGALGCAKPGDSYIQMLVAGYRIVLRAGAKQYSYHGADGEPPFRCDRP